MLPEFRPQVSAALASASLLARPVFPERADLYLRTARALYRWAADRPGALACMQGIWGDMWCHMQACLIEWQLRCNRCSASCTLHRWLPSCCPPGPHRCAGLFAKSYEGYPEWLYGTSYFRDKLMLAAGWLFRATGAESIAGAMRANGGSCLYEGRVCYRSAVAVPPAAAAARPSSFAPLCRAVPTCCRQPAAVSHAVHLSACWSRLPALLLC